MGPLPGKDISRPEAALPPPAPPGAPPLVKVCGLRRLEDALLAHDLGAAFLGLVFAEDSPRRITLEEAAELLAQLRAAAAPRVVGVFRGQSWSFAADAARQLGLFAVQMHAPLPDESIPALPVPVILGLGVSRESTAGEIEALVQSGLSRAAGIVLDTAVEGRSGGTGVPFDHGKATRALAAGRVFLAGGLSPENIGETLARLAPARPYAVDLSSSIETAPGVKCPRRMADFFRALVNAPSIAG